ncbi:MAG TPA: nuclear transport factor 2 family protein [Acidimicrobiales bacterium]|nr:nuclear transport factor 2 family protein [Acidimicrobiales bacterium]
MTAEEVVHAYLTALNAHDPDAVCALVADDFYNEHTGVRAESVRGRASYRNRLPAFLETFAGLRYDVEDVAVDPPRVVVAYRMSAEYAGGHDGARRFALRGVFWFEVRDALIVHRTDYHDGASFEHQVGLR